MLPFREALACARGAGGVALLVARNGPAEPNRKAIRLCDPHCASQCALGAQLPTMSADTDGCVLRLHGCPEFWAIARAANRPGCGEVRITFVDAGASAAAGAWKLSFRERIEAVRVQPCGDGLSVVMLADGVGAAITASVSLSWDGGAIRCRTSAVTHCKLPPGGLARCLALDEASGSWFCGAGTTLSAWNGSASEATPLLELDGASATGTAELAPWPWPPREWGGGGGGGVLLMLQSQGDGCMGLAGCGASADTGRPGAKRAKKGAQSISAGGWAGVDPLLAVWAAPRSGFEGACARPSAHSSNGGGGSVQPSGRQCRGVRLALDSPGKQGAAYLLLRGAKKSPPERTPPMARRWVHAAPLEPGFGVALPMCAVLEGGVALLDCTPAAVAANSARLHSPRDAALPTVSCPVICWLAPSLPVPPGLAPDARQARAASVDADIVDTSLRLPRRAAGGARPASNELVSCSRVLSTSSAAGEWGGRVLQWQIAPLSAAACSGAGGLAARSGQLWGASDLQPTRASAAAVAELARPAPLIGGKCEAPQLVQGSNSERAENEASGPGASPSSLLRGLRHVAPGVTQAVAALDALPVPGRVRITFGAGDAAGAAEPTVARAAQPETPGRAFPSTPGGSRRPGAVSSGLGLSGPPAVCARASSDWALPHDGPNPPMILRFASPPAADGTPAGDTFVMVGTRAAASEQERDIAVLIGGPGRGWSQPGDGVLVRPWGGINRPLLATGPWTGLGWRPTGRATEFPDAASIVAAASRAIAIGLPPTSAGLTMKLLRERGAAARARSESGTNSNPAHAGKLRGRIRARPGHRGASLRAPVVAWPARSGADGLRPDPLAVRRKPLVAPMILSAPDEAPQDAAEGGISIHALRRLETAAFRPLEAAADAISLLCGPVVAGASASGAVALGTVARADRSPAASAGDISQPAAPLRLHAPARALFAALLHNTHALDGVLGHCLPSEPLARDRPAGVWRKSVAAALLGDSAHRRLAKWEMAVQRSQSMAGLSRPAQLRVFAKARRAEQAARADCNELQLHLSRRANPSQPERKLVTVSLDHLNTRRQVPLDSDPAVCAELRKQWVGTGLAGSQLAPHWEDDLAAILRAEGVQPAEAPREAEPATSQQLLNELSAALAGLE